MVDETYAAMNLEPGPARMCHQVVDTGWEFQGDPGQDFDPFSHQGPGKARAGLSTTWPSSTAMMVSFFARAKWAKAPPSRFIFRQSHTGGRGESVGGDFGLLRGHNELVLVVDDESLLSLVQKC